MVIIEMILLPMIFLQIGLGESRGYAGKNERLGERMRGPTQYSTEDPLLGQEVESTGKVSCAKKFTHRGVSEESFHLQKSQLPHP